NRFIFFADDIVPRWITASVMVDYDTVAGGDKFGNFFVLRLPRELSDELADDSAGNKLFFEREYLNGAPTKVTRQYGTSGCCVVGLLVMCWVDLQLELVSHFYLGDTVTSIQRTALTTGGREILVYSTLLGGIGIMVPFPSRDDIEFFQTLEFQMRR